MGSQSESAHLFNQDLSWGITSKIYLVALWTGSRNGFKGMEKMNIVENKIPMTVHLCTAGSYFLIFFYVLPPCCVKDCIWCLILLLPQDPEWEERQWEGSDKDNKLNKEKNWSTKCTVGE